MISVFAALNCLDLFLSLVAEIYSCYYETPCEAKNSISIAHATFYSAKGTLTKACVVRLGCGVFILRFKNVDIQFVKWY